MLFPRTADRTWTLKSYAFITFKHGNLKTTYLDDQTQRLKGCVFMIFKHGDWKATRAYAQDLKCKYTRGKT